jgi:hypothetical protein
MLGYAVRSTQPTVYWRIRSITPQYSQHRALYNAHNPALPFYGRANSNKACFQQASFRLAPGFHPGAVYAANRGV